MLLIIFPTVKQTWPCRDDVLPNVLYCSFLNTYLRKNINWCFEFYFMCYLNVPIVNFPDNIPVSLHKGYISLTRYLMFPIRIWLMYGCCKQIKLSITFPTVKQTWPCRDDVLPNVFYCSFLNTHLRKNINWCFKFYFMCYSWGKIIEHLYIPLNR
jgi:hypothetical protein